MRTISVIILCFLLIAGSAFAENLTPQQDQELYNRILTLTGTAPLSQSAVEGDQYHIKCGTPELMEMWFQLDQASEKTQTLWISLLEARYGSQAPDTFGSPDGHFLIHYAASGTHGVRMDDEFGIDPATNVPEYVTMTADIYDSVYNFEVNFLGYKPQPLDGFYPAGIDDRYDVYLVDLDQVGWSGAYGVTYPDSLFRINSSPRQYATSFMLLDNDYMEYQIYKDRPRDVIEVTAAHEFFHAICFGYDATEFETRFQRRHWAEMSCVWMEDRMYDDINDYLYYLPTFYAYINESLISGSPALYQYGAVVWPKYLSQKWGDEIIKSIWDLCEEDPGPNVFQNGFQDAIADASAQTETFASALSEFYIWNYFTGDRTRPNFGFEEAETWAQVPDRIRVNHDTLDFILSYEDYPLEFNDPEYDFYPSHFGAAYVRFAGFSQLDSSLHITFNGATDHGAYDITWNNRIAGYNPHLPEGEVYVDPTIYSGSYTATLPEDLLIDYSEIIMVLSPYGETPANISDLDSLWFTLNVSDTSAPIENVVISEPFPNPYLMSKPGNEAVFVEIIQPEPQTIKMQVHTLAGERVFLKEFPTSAVTTLVRWEGLNDSGEQVASGMYLIYISAGDVNKVSKIAIIE